MPRWLPWWWRGFLSAWRTGARPSKALLIKVICTDSLFSNDKYLLLLKSRSMLTVEVRQVCLPVENTPSVSIRWTPPCFIYTINNIILIVICRRRVVIFRANAILDTKATLHSFSVVGMKNTRWRPGNSADGDIWQLKLVLKYKDVDTWNREDIQPTILEGHFGTTQPPNLGSVSRFFQVLNYRI